MPSTLKTCRQRQHEDRVVLASLRQQGLGVRAIAHTLRRSPSTVSRGLRRNAEPAGYASTSARTRDQQRRLSARPARKLAPEGAMFGVGRQWLGWRRSPEQIALTPAHTPQQER
ncbi:helix-turn-helix domain-containing protein [Ottowia sp.]|uniref:helix-turn-helix domain-containing protein n=1 Tax=Ottowia sp. TaxID=1898956 RepID=UPI00260D620F|nr:helix-turn-helix domain-containing protein [Ottowia sp.]